MRILFLSRLSANLGDKNASIMACIPFLNQLVMEVSPSDGLFPGDARFTSGDLSEPEEWARERWDMILVGGGGLIGPKIFEPGWSALIELQTRLALFGVGENFSKGQALSRTVSTILSRHQDANFFCRFRDADRHQFTPCPSLSRPELSAIHATQKAHDAVGYWHDGRQIPRKFRKLPFLTNRETSLDKVILHMKRSEKVISNSYHGVIWARALGLAVESVDTHWSTKFRNIHPDSGDLGLQRKLLAKAAVDLREWIRQ